MHNGEVMYLGCVCLWGELGSWIVMISACVLWMSSLSSSSLFWFRLCWPAVWWALSFTTGYMSLRGTLSGCDGCCDCDACTVVCVACVYAERVWGCSVYGNVGVGDGWSVVVVSAGHVGGTRGSGIVYSAADVLWMSVVRGMRGVGGVCD